MGTCGNVLRPQLRNDAAARAGIAGKQHGPVLILHYWCIDIDIMDGHQIDSSRLAVWLFIVDCIVPYEV